MKRKNIVVRMMFYIIICLFFSVFTSHLPQQTYDYSQSENVRDIYDAVPFADCFYCGKLELSHFERWSNVCKDSKYIQAGIFMALSMEKYSSSERKEIIAWAEENGWAEEDYSLSVKELFQTSADCNNLWTDDGEYFYDNSNSMVDVYNAMCNLSDFDFTPSGYKNNPKFKTYHVYFDRDSNGVWSVHRGKESSDPAIFSCKQNYDVLKSWSYKDLISNRSKREELKVITARQEDLRGFENAYDIYIQSKSEPTGTPKPTKVPTTTPIITKLPDKTTPTPVPTQAVTPIIKLKKLQGRSSVKITISKTKSAEGYRIFMKVGDGTFKRIKTLKKNGTKQRTYTIKNLDPGTYSFRVRSYMHKDGKLILGTRSKTKKITLK